MTKRGSTVVKEREKRGLEITTDLSADGVAHISHALRELLADGFVLYLKTKNFHWHMSGRHFRDYHLLLDEHGDQLFAMTDAIAERARKIGGAALRSIMCRTSKSTASRGYERAGSACWPRARKGQLSWHLLVESTPPARMKIGKGKSLGPTRGPCPVIQAT